MHASSITKIITSTINNSDHFFFIETLCIEKKSGKKGDFTNFKIGKHGNSYIFFSRHQDKRKTKEKESERKKKEQTRYFEMSLGGENKIFKQLK